MLSEKKCHHIKAVRMSINYMDIEQDRAKLHTLLRKSRGFITGRKKIPKNVAVVDAADDSELFHAEKDTIKSFMIPTATKSDSVKRRFIQKPQDNEITPTKICRTHSTPKRYNNDNIIDTTQFSSICSNVVDTEIPKEKPIIISDGGHTFLKTHTDVPSFSINNKLHDTQQDTFEMKYNKLQTFKVCGRYVNKKHLEPLYHTKDSVKDSTELYLYGTVIGVYLSILCHEENNTDKSVTFFTCDDMILSHYNESETANMAMLKVGMREFLTYRVPEYDIVLLPVCKFNHCYLIVVFTKLYNIMFLDSNLNSVNRDDIKFTIKLFKLYYNFFGKDFDEKRFTIYGPKVFQ